MHALKQLNGLSKQSHLWNYYSEEKGVKKFLRTMSNKILFVEGIGKIKATPAQVMAIITDTEKKKHGGIQCCSMDVWSAN